MFDNYTKHFVYTWNWLTLEHKQLILTMVKIKQCGMSRERKYITIPFLS